MEEAKEYYVEGTYISASNCSDCTLNSTKVASSDCPLSRDVSIWFRWCYLRYSNESFFGNMQQTAVAITNDTDFDDPSVVSEGLPFMSGLAAAAPEKSFMFHTEVLNTSQSGKKRYGMAQCSRDINRVDCRRCLDSQLDNFRTIIGNKRRWEIYGSNCFMWYNDYQFYSNSSTLLSGSHVELIKDPKGAYSQLIRLQEIKGSEQNSANGIDKLESIVNFGRQSSQRSFL